MFDPSSRYYRCETAMLSVTEGSGRSVQVAYKRRRFLPQPGAQTTLLQVVLREGERVDAVAAQAFGDPQQSFRLVDANPVLHPDELLQGRRRVRIAMPLFSGS